MVEMAGGREEGREEGREVRKERGRSVNLTFANGCGKRGEDAAGEARERESKR
jgi:hypothetical protein